MISIFQSISFNTMLDPHVPCAMCHEVSVYFFTTDFIHIFRVRPLFIQSCHYCELRPSPLKGILASCVSASYLLFFCLCVALRLLHMWISPHLYAFTWTVCWVGIAVSVFPSMSFRLLCVLFPNLVCSGSLWSHRWLFTVSCSHCLSILFLVLEKPVG